MKKKCTPDAPGCELSDDFLDGVSGGTGTVTEYMGYKADMYSSLTNSEVGSSSSPNATDLTPKPMPCENVYKVPLNEEVPESLRPFTED